MDRNMNKILIILLFIFINCSTAMKISPGNNIKKLYEKNIIPKNKFFIKNINFNRAGYNYISNPIFKKFIVMFSDYNNKYFKRINSINYDYYIDIEIIDVSIEDNSIKNFFMQTYGIWILIPFWNGLSYTSIAQKFKQSLVDFPLFFHTNSLLPYYLKY